MENNSKPSMLDPFLIIFLLISLVAAISLFWNYAHAYIAIFYVYIRYIEVFPFWVIGKYIDVPLFNESYHYIYNLCKPSNYSIIGLCTRDMSTISIKEMSGSSYVINSILSVIVLYKTYKLTKTIKKRHPKLNFKREHNIKSFMNDQKVNHQHLEMFTRIDLLDKDLKDPVYGMSLTIRQFCYKNKLIKGWQECDDKSFIPVLDIARLENVLTAQLGELWTGKKLNELSDSELILMAIAIPRVAATDTSLSDDEYRHAMNESKKIMKKMWSIFGATSFDKNDGFITLDLDLTNEKQVIIEYYKKSDKVKQIFNKHAYVRTIIYGLITEARRLGVLSAADMGWMQFYDREMFYILSTIGRQTSFPESCAVLSHFLYEARLEEGYPEPLINKATDGVKHVMSEVYKFTKEDVKNYNESNPI